MSTFRIGGTERQCNELLKRIDRSRFEVFVCCLQKKGELLDELADIAADIVDLDLVGKYWRRLIPTLWMLNRWIRREHIDIVHTYLFYSNIVGVLAGKLAGVQVILSKRALDVNWMPRRHKMINRLIHSLADRITVVSDGVGRSAIERDKIPAEKIVRIYNGVDSVEFSRHTDGRAATRGNLGIAGNSPVIGTVAHFRNVKGHKYLLEAAAKIIRNFPDAVFLWIGEGELEKDLRNTVKSRRLDANIRFLGYRVDISALLEAMDIFVLPSVEEGMSNALLEAMAKKIPVIATDVGGNPEIVEHERSGLLVPSRSPSALADAICRLLNQPSFALSMAEGGRQRVIDRFRIEDKIRQLESFYEEVVNQTTSHR